MVTTVIAPQMQRTTQRTTRSSFRPPLRALFSFPAMLAVLLAGLVFATVKKSTADPDIGWHLRNAQYLIQHRTFVRTDMYSFTTGGKPWMDPEWLAEVPFYLGWRWMGRQGVFLVEYLALSLILLGIFWLATLESGNAKGALLASILALVFATVSYGPRTLLFGWIFLIAELAVLHKFPKHRRALWVLPPLFLVWVNTHGSWLIGLAVFVIYALSGCVEGEWGAIVAKRWSRRQMRTLVTVSVLSVAALFVNPYGWRLPEYPYDMAFHQKLNIASIMEWRSLDFHGGRGKIALFALLVAIVVQLARGRKWKLHEVGFLLLGLYAGFTYSRFLFLAAILIVPLMAKDLADFMPRYKPERDLHWLNAIVMAGCIAAICWKFPTNAQLRKAEAVDYPVQARTFLENFHPQGRVLNDYLWGGYMIWNVRQVPDFVDSRVDIFEHHGVFKDYIDLTQLRGSLKILDKYDIQYVFFSKSAPFSYLLEHTPGWTVEYKDKNAILFERSRAGTSVR